MSHHFTRVFQAPFGTANAGGEQRLACVSNAQWHWLAGQPAWGASFGSPPAFGCGGSWIAPAHDATDSKSLGNPSAFQSSGFAQAAVSSGGFAAFAAVRQPHRWDSNEHAMQKPTGFGNLAQQQVLESLLVLVACHHCEFCSRPMRSKASIRPSKADLRPWRSRSHGTALRSTEPVIAATIWRRRRIRRASPGTITSLVCGHVY